jgi:hypothetical protein
MSRDSGIGIEKGGSRHSGLLVVAVLSNAKL